jgi:DHA1 family tetracycline resistance protein-like MFS transporter
MAVRSIWLHYSVSRNSQRRSTATRVTALTPTAGPLSARLAARRVVPFVFFTVFLDLVGFGIILPLLPFYVNAMGGSAETVGIIFGFFSFTQLLATPILGRMSDRYGRRRVILVSLAGNALSMLAFALATKLLLLPLLFASRIFAGATAGNLAACQAAISDVTTAEERAIGMGRIGAGINLGLIVGPLVGSALSGIGAWAPPLAAGALAILDFAGAFFFMPETLPLRAEPLGRAPPPVRRSGALIEWPILAVLLIFFFAFLGVTNMQVALALLAHQRFDWGPRQVGWLFAIFGTTSFIVQGILLGRLTRWLGEIRLVTIGSACSAGGMLLIAEGPGLIGLVGGVALFGVGFGATTPLLSSLASQAARQDIRGFVLGILQSSGGLARTVGPLLGGILFHRVAPGAPFLGGVIAASICVALSTTLKRSGARSEA